MTSDTTGTRTNRQGDPCPGWCQMDHSGRFADSHVGPAAQHVFTAIDPATPLYPEDRRVTVYAPYGPAVSLTLRTDLEAGRLADFLDGMAGTPADEIREMAAAVRAASEVLFR